MRNAYAERDFLSMNVMNEWIWMDGWLDRCDCALCDVTTTTTWHPYIDLFSPGFLIANWAFGRKYPLNAVHDVKPFNCVYLNGTKKRRNNTRTKNSREYYPYLVPFATLSPPLPSSIGAIVTTTANTTTRANDGRTWNVNFNDAGDWYLRVWFRL